MKIIGFLRYVIFAPMLAVWVIEVLFNPAVALTLKTWAAGFLVTLGPLGLWCEIQTLKQPRRPGSV